MDIEKLGKWAELLLDTGKRNNLINFKDTKLGTAEIVAPDQNVLLKGAENAVTFEVYDPKLAGDDDDEDENLQGITDEKFMSKEEYLTAYAKKIKQNRMLIYNAAGKPIRALQNIGRRAATAIEETGVNIAYAAFGFVNWTESENSEIEMRAPLLLVPVSIENKSAVDPFTVRFTDGDVVVNPTFSYKLRNEYGITLPEYDEDDGFDGYLEKVSELVKKLKWIVSSECKIGIFSFLKINMYQDLKDNIHKISGNNSVRALLGEYDSSCEQNVAEDTEHEINFSDLHNVVDADSSQCEAISTAKAGKNFVLQGPPGTGKSQTITNIIAECLMDGKKVLFVSEKLAALNVVYDKLKKAGLDEFCLELHSHKSNKKQVIDELCRTLRLGRSGLSDRAEKEARLKQDAKDKLDAYAAELHKVRPGINKSVYQMYEEISACRELSNTDFIVKDINNKDEAYIEGAEELLKRYAGYTVSVGKDYHDNPWYGYTDLGGGYEGTVRLKSDLQALLSLCSSLEEINKEAYARYGVSAESITEAYALGEIFRLSGESGYITPSLLDIKIQDGVIQTVKQMKSKAENIRYRKAVLDKKFNEDIYKLDGRVLYKKLARDYGSVISRLFKREYKRIINDIRLCAKDNKKPNYMQAITAVDTLNKYREDLKAFGAAEMRVKGMLGPEYAGPDTDFDKLLQDLESVRSSAKRVKDLSGLLKTAPDKFADEGLKFCALAQKYASELEKNKKASERLAINFNAETFDVLKTPITDLKTRLCSCLENMHALDNWRDFLKLLDVLRKNDLLEFIDLTISKGIEPDQIVGTYKRAFYIQRVSAILSETPVLTGLSRVPHDEMIACFREKDVLQFEINQAKIRAELSSRRPTLDMVAQGSAVSVLLREGEKKRKKKGIRALLSEIGDLVQTLKPCLLMSPLSVSTFLSPDIKFDIVIFDEASQIFPQDAIGAIYRGRQLVVVGDSKQMPPSNFFNAAIDAGDEDEDGAENITDFESILDLCSVSFIRRRLRWHYRSRFEQLISFSNKNFYDNELITFPSSKADAKWRGVDFYYVNGTFDRKSRTNRVEAERIVDLVFENLKKFPDRSLGVVAFSISQQSLIERLLYKRRQQNAEYEEYFRSDRPEPFFVKNLETVQGDERDTIIFSIAYAKDAQGRLIFNFGPINREGGERRLNVAITRAKINVQVVSSMRGRDIDTTRTKSVGARLLGEYLDYAENGAEALKSKASTNAETGASTVNRFDRHDSEFEREVCEFLRERGFFVDTQVGCSSFRIDMAVKRPDSSDYVLAIECDGATYHSSKTARDRDRLRQDILEQMGWKFYRIWSTDWFRNKQIEKERLIDAVKKALDDFPEGLEEKIETDDGPGFTEPLKETRFEFPKYEMVDAYAAAKAFNNNILSVIRAITHVESPIATEWLLKRIVFLFDGRTKVTNLVREQFDIKMMNCSRMGIERRDGFLYMTGKDIPMLRVPNSAYAPREIKYIELKELASGLKEIIKRNVTAEKQALFRFLAKTLGFNRLGDAITDRMEAALKLLSEEIEVNGNTVSLKK